MYMVYQAIIQIKPRLTGQLCRRGVISGSELTL